ncbi:WhiB family transcriptional regulator [Streptomyces sp. NPDC004376]
MTRLTYRIHGTTRPTDWRDQAICRGQSGKGADPWWPQPSDTSAVQAATNLCRTRCPVMYECAQHALTQPEDEGIWGGLDENQRRRIRKKYTSGRLNNPDTVILAVDSAIRQEHTQPADELRNLWDAYTKPLPGGHIGWSGPDSSTFSWHGHTYTPKRLAFLVDRGHPPVGIVRRLPDCPVIECIHPRHIADNRERHQRTAAEREATAGLAS